MSEETRSYENEKVKNEIKRIYEKYRFKRI